MLKSRLRARLRPAQWSRWPDELPPFRGCRAPAAWPQTDTPVLPWTWRASPLSPWTGSAAPGLPWTRTETPLPPRTESAAPVRMCIGAALLVQIDRSVSTWVHTGRVPAFSVHTGRHPAPLVHTRACPTPARSLHRQISSSPPLPLRGDSQPIWSRRPRRSGRVVQVGSAGVRKTRDWPCSSVG
jgi:hypothetical protein